MPRARTFLAVSTLLGTGTLALSRASSYLVDFEAQYPELPAPCTPALTAALTAAPPTHVLGFLAAPVVYFMLPGLAVFGGLPPSPLIHGSVAFRLLRCDAATIVAE